MQSAPNDPKPNSRNRVSKTFYMCSIEPWVPKFRQFCSTISRFEIFYSLGFTIDAYIKTSKCQESFKTWPIAQKSDSLYSAMVANVLIKFVWHEMKTVGGEAFEIYSPIWACTCWEKVQSAIKSLADRQKSNSLYWPLIIILYVKFGWNLMKPVEGVVFRKSLTRKFCKVHRMTPNQGVRH